MDANDAARGRRGPGGCAAAVLLALAAGCAGATTPVGQPTGRDGWVLYTVGALRFEAPAGWAPSGTARQLRLVAPGGGAQLEVSAPEPPQASAAACMEEAGRVMKRAEAMERVRRHPTTFGGARALFAEGDSGAWHVWAWAACDGGSPYRVFLTARSPAPPEVTEVYRTLTGSARIGGQV